MKKIILITITCGTLSIANAQISKGSILLGGGVNISNTKYDNNNTSLVDKTHDNHTSINPAVGVAIKENLVMGISLNYGHSENTTNPYQSNPSKSEYTSYGGGIFLRKYLVLGKNFYLFGQGDLNYTDYKQKGFGNPVQNGWTTALSLSPGISYAINKRFHLETSISNLLSLSYGKSKIEAFPNNNQLKQEKTNFNLNTNTSPFSNFNIGFRFLFAK